MATYEFYTQSDVDNFPSGVTHITGNVYLHKSLVQNLNGLNAVTTIDGFLYFYFNDLLSDLTGLSSLTSIGGYLYIDGNRSLTSLAGLGNLSSVGCYLYINRNSSLTSTSGLNPNMIVGGYTYLDFSSALPINLISFIAKNIGTYNVLDWRTATETNNTGFDIERSNGASAFEKTGFVRGALNSSSIQNYNFTDEKPLQYGSYYRLKQIDIDGKFTYSNIIFVETLNATPLQLQISPNPSSDKIYVSGIENNSAYSITNVQGQTILSGVFAHNEAIDVSALPKSLYFFRTNAQVVKFIKQNAN